MQDYRGGRAAEGGLVRGRPLERWTGFDREVALAAVVEDNINGCDEREGMEG